MLVRQHRYGYGDVEQERNRHLRVGSEGGYEFGRIQQNIFRPELAQLSQPTFRPYQVKDAGECRRLRS